jgi:DNA invertase Pin-like site-specific DNA recombinase
LKAGRARGRIGGRPRKLSNEQFEVMKKMHADKTILLSTITDTFKISRSHMYQILARGKKEDKLNNKLRNN